MLEGKFHFYDFSNKGGWLLSHFHQNKYHSSLIQFGRTDFVDSWFDPATHYHTTAYEVYLVMHGELWVLVDDFSIALKEGNLLLVQPRVPHAVVGGKGPIQNFTLKIPCSSDEKKVVRKLSQKERSKAPSFINGNELVATKGFFADFSQEEHRNCWLFGFGIAKYLIDEFSLAYMIYEDEKEEKADGHPNDFHFH